MRNLQFSLSLGKIRIHSEINHPSTTPQGSPFLLQKSASFNVCLLPNSLRKFWPYADMIRRCVAGIKSCIGIVDVSVLLRNQQGARQETAIFLLKTLDNRRISKMSRRNVRFTFIKWHHRVARVRSHDLISALQRLGEAYRHFVEESITGFFPDLDYFT